MTVSACSRKVTAWSWEPRATARSAAAFRAIRAWAGEGVGLGTLGGVPVGGEVVAGERAGELIGPERLEEAGGGEVAGLAVAPGERVVGDLPDERLDEGVLAALGRAGVGLEGEELAPDEGAQAGLQLGLRDAGHGRRGRRG